jgi:hypothetical protein
MAHDRWNELLEVVYLDVGGRDDGDQGWSLCHYYGADSFGLVRLKMR